MCVMVIFLEYLNIPSYYVSVDTDIKGLPRLSILHNIDKVKCVFQFALVGTSGLDIIQFRIRRRFMIYTWSFSMTSSNIPTIDIL